MYCMFLDDRDLIKFDDDAIVNHLDIRDMDKKVVETGAVKLEGTFSHTAASTSVSSASLIRDFMVFQEVKKVKF